MTTLFSLRGRATRIGVTDGRLNGCPASPNCVCSDNGDTAHAIEPLRLASESADVWPQVERAVREFPRTRVTSCSADYLHAECASALFGFVDDLELHLRRDHGIIAVRSAARLGYADFGVNRRRIERLRAILRARGIVR